VFFSQHNPAKLGNVHDIAAKYAGRQEELFGFLRKRYGASAVATTAPAAAVLPPPALPAARSAISDAAGSE